MAKKVSMEIDQTMIDSLMEARNALRIRGNNKDADKVSSLINFIKENGEEVDGPS